ncbi:hypothetical protein IAU60_004923 [Kwoniella sp. DSM 27419]
MSRLVIDTAGRRPPTRSAPAAPHLPDAKHVHTHPTRDYSQLREGTDASLTFIGTATTLLHFPPLTIMTDPNFLHAGDHVHLGPGVTGTRVTDPSVDLHELPNIDLVLLSHYHADHFDQKVEDELRRDLPIITTPHARECLVDKKEQGERFEQVTALDTWESVLVDTQGGEENTSVRVTAMPGKHVPPGLLEKANDLLGAVSRYRIYITGDTLLIDDLTEIPARYSKAGKPIDLMLAHLGGTTIPGPKIPLLMVTMDAKMGVELVKMVDPDLTIPIHFDDYDVFASPLSDFKDEVKKAGLEDKVVFLDRGDRYSFKVAK